MNITSAVIQPPPVSTAKDLQRESQTGPVESGEAQVERSISNYDEFVPGDVSESKNPAGLYKASKDENGNPKIVVDAPQKKQSDPSAEKPPENKKKEKGQITKVSVEQVEAEIKKLKEARQRVQQQLKQCADNPEKRAGLERQLAGIDAELQLKDNEAYKRQHAKRAVINVG